MAQDWVVTVDGRVAQVASGDRLRSVLAAADADSPHEVWLVSPLGASMCMLSTQGRALLLFVRAAGDSGFTSRSDPPMAGASTTLFRLANGQLDEYPTGWTISAERAHEALEHFLETGERPAFVPWNDDAAG